MTTTLVEVGARKAKEVLRTTCSPLGSMAAEKGYPQVWARDSVITSLGLSLLEGYRGCLRRSLETLRGQQSSLGAIPNNVSVATGRLDHTNAGSVDSNLWYILGHYYHYQMTHDREFLLESYDSLEKAFLWLRYQDSNGCGLLEVHEAADWADLLANRYNVLYDNVLYYGALRAMAALAQLGDRESKPYLEMARDVKEKINFVLWVGPEKECKRESKHAEWSFTLSQIDPVLVKRPYFLPYVAFRDFGDYCDVFGNLLTVFFGLASPAQEKRILDYLHQVGIAEPYPVRVLHPVIYPGNKDWREYYRNNNLNLPNQYHNGGIWPFVGGFYVATLVKVGRQAEARRQLERLAEVNRLGVDEEWEFNEWCHGETGRPMGCAHQSWSAGMYIYAYRCAEAGRVIVFDRDEGW